MIGVGVVCVCVCVHIRVMSLSYLFSAMLLPLGFVSSYAGMTSWVYAIDSTLCNGCVAVMLHWGTVAHHACVRRFALIWCSRLNSDSNVLCPQVSAVEGA
jgi:hypothetical protein